MAVSAPVAFGMSFCWPNGLRPLVFSSNALHSADASCRFSSNSRRPSSTMHSFKMGLYSLQAAFLSVEANSANQLLYAQCGTNCSIYAGSGWKIKSNQTTFICGDNCINCVRWSLVRACAR